MRHINDKFNKNGHLKLYCQYIIYIKHFNNNIMNMADDVLFDLLHLEIVTYFISRGDEREFVRILSTYLWCIFSLCSLGLNSIEDNHLLVVVR